MICGSCLCGGVRFEITKAAGTFELCHCSRCRKVSGSAFVAALFVADKDFRFVAGTDLITTYEAPIIEAPPAYRQVFCSRCGCPVPNPTSSGLWFVPAGALDDDPEVRPDKHIYVEYKAPWDRISDDLPQMTKQEITAYRAQHAANNLSAVQEVVQPTALPPS